MTATLIEPEVTRKPAVEGELADQLASIVGSKIKDPESLESVRLTLRKRAQEDLWFFSYHVYGNKDLDTGLHLDMASMWQRRRHRRFTLQLIPRSHCKTSLWTEAGTLWECVQDINTLADGRTIPGHDLKCLIVNAKLDNAKAILANIRNVVSTSAMFAFLFPEYVPSERWQNGRSRGKWTEERIDFPCSRLAGGKEGNIQIMSVGASLVSRHYDLIVFDDPINDENSATKPLRDKLHKWYKNALQLRVDIRSSRIRLIGTRWHYDELYGRIIRTENERREQGKNPQYLFYIRKAIENGEPIWPERFTLDTLEELKDKNNLGSYIYSCQYDNDPVPEEDALFARDDIKIVSDLTIPDNVVNFAAVDFADDESTRGDFTVITIGSFDELGNMYIRRIYRGKYSLLQMTDLIQSVIEPWDVSLVAVETQAFQKALVRGYQREAEQKGYYIPWLEVTRGNTSKFRRVLALQHRVESGQFYVEEDIDNIDWLIEEMITFPLGVHDDILDTVADLEAIYMSARKSIPVEPRPEYETYSDAIPELDSLDNDVDGELSYEEFLQAG